jgi:hypothetical protein
VLVPTISTVLVREFALPTTAVSDRLRHTALPLDRR